MRDDEARQINSDQRVFKPATVYDDRHNGFIATIVDEMGLRHLARPRIVWELPRYVRFKYSKVSKEHQEAKIRRNKNANRRRFK